MMDWWILKQLRAMVLTDLQNFIPEGHFESEPDKFKFSETTEGAKQFSSELRWGYLAGTLGKQLFFDGPSNLSPRQVSASDVLMNLGILAAAEAMHGLTKQLAIKAKNVNISDGNANNVANQLENEQIPTLLENIKGALKQYLLYLNPSEQTPFIHLLGLDQGNVNKHQDINPTLLNANVDIPSSELNQATFIDIKTHYFDVAFSFPGENRTLVHDIANILEVQMGPHSYFYDFNYQAQLARPSLDTLLQDIYRKRARLIVVFLSRDYQLKKWCNIEFHAIREIIFEHNHDQIMYIRTDDGQVDGTFKTDGYIDANKFSPKEIANFIHERVKLLQGHKAN